MNICNELRVSLFLQARVISSFHFISPFSSFFLLRGSGAPEPFLFVPQKGARKDCPSPISPAQTSAPAGDAPLGAIPCPKAPLCKGSWLHYVAPAKAQRKRVWWGEEVRRRERDLPRLSGARRGIHSPHRRDGGIDRLTLQSQACQPGGDASRWGFLLSGQKEPKSA